MTQEEFLNLDLDSLYSYTRNITYGWMDSKGKKHFCSNNDDLEYHLQTPEETLERNIAICWDQVELLRYYFEKKKYQDINTYLIYMYITDDYCPSHSIITYKENNNYIWFSPDFSKDMGGIFKYQSEQELIEDLKKRFIKHGLNEQYFSIANNLENIVCYKYQKPSFHIRGSAFYNHCRKGKKVI